MTARPIAVVLVVSVFLGSACAARQMLGPDQPRDVATPIVLLPPEGDPTGCRVSFKEATVRSHAGKRLIFTVDNYCNSEQWVMVGNFRTEETLDPSPANCEAAAAPGVARIFQQDSPAARRKRVGGGSPGKPRRASINLTIRQGTELPGSGELTYYYDVCLNDVIAEDPRLIIER